MANRSDEPLSATEQFKIGCRYRDGDGVRQDNATAIEWYKKAAAQGHTWAMWWIAAIYYKAAQNNRKNPFKRLFASRTGNPNIASAIEWYEKVVTDGNDDQRRDNALCRLAEIYSDGELVKPNREKALEYLRAVPDSSSCSDVVCEMLKEIDEAK